MYLLIYASIYWSIYQFIYLSIYLSVYVLMYPCIYVCISQCTCICIEFLRSELYGTNHGIMRCQIFMRRSNMHPNDIQTFSNNCTLACIQEVGSTVSCLFIIISRMYSRFELPLLDGNTTCLILSKKIFPQMLFTSVVWIFERWSPWIVLHVAICRWSSKNQMSFAKEPLRNVELSLKRALVVLHKQGSILQSKDAISTETKHIRSLLQMKMLHS